MTDLRLVTDTDPPYDAQADGLGCYLDAIAVKRLALLVAGALADYCLNTAERRDMLPSEFVALRLATGVPGLLDLMRGQP